MRDIMSVKLFSTFENPAHNLRHEYEQLRSCSQGSDCRAYLGVAAAEAGRRWVRPSSLSPNSLGPSTRAQPLAAPDQLSC